MKINVRGTLTWWRKREGVKKIHSITKNLTNKKKICIKYVVELEDWYYITRKECYKDKYLFLLIKISRAWIATWNIEKSLLEIIFAVQHRILKKKKREYTYPRMSEIYWFERSILYEEKKKKNSRTCVSITKEGEWIFDGPSDFDGDFSTKLNFILCIANTRLS